MSQKELNQNPDVKFTPLPTKTTPEKQSLGLASVSRRREKMHVLFDARVLTRYVFKCCGIDVPEICLPLFNPMFSDVFFHILSSRAKSA